MNTSAQSTKHPNQLQNTKAHEDLEQDSEEEIEAIIEDELVRCTFIRKMSICALCKSKW
jgi:hypothetical protein